jgi:two-component system, OmpR family, sensor histidine kinase BaeS
VTPATPATLASLHEEVMRLVRLVNALHQLSQFDARMSRLRRTEVDVTVLARGVVTAYAPEFQRRGFAVQEAYDPAEQHVHADADLLGQALRTLVDNVLQYAPDGATVTVRTARTGHAVRITVENTGEEIAPEDLPHIFERFYRGEKSRSRATGGAGIGVSLVQEIARAHGGDTGARSANGLTVVWFTVAAR